MEVQEWIRNMEAGVLAAIEMARINVLEGGGVDKELGAIEEYEKLYNKIEMLCTDQKEFHEYILGKFQGPGDSSEGFQEKIRLEKITQKLENTKEYLKECIKSEMQNVNYIETLIIMWKHS
ncbi:hypothetical protein OJ253_2142 [Cryptosporidium canis]|uniref:Uncharacterized protein n=1 Tax=Cryptosporidium canis TaxID=195482 RepID=A0A9D5HWY0_9CRYT|nr:hypothetical protein OJ253_2142 [Cryptosporidium canis]